MPPLDLHPPPASIRHVRRGAISKTEERDLVAAELMAALEDGTLHPSRLGERELRRLIRAAGIDAVADALVTASRSHDA